MMEVIAHPALGEHLNPVALNSDRKDLDEALAIVRRLRRWSLAIAASHHVVDPVRNTESGSLAMSTTDSNDGPRRKRVEFLRVSPSVRTKVAEFADAKPIRRCISCASGLRKFIAGRRRRLSQIQQNAKKRGLSPNQHLK